MANSYDRLYENMKNRLTVVENNAEYTLGDFMVMKADVKKNESNLPVAQRSSATRGEKTVAMLVSYFNDKLTVKEAPVKDKTIRAFPLRASMSALLSAAVACVFIFSVGIIGSGVLGSASSPEFITVESVEDIESEVTASANK